MNSSQFVNAESIFSNPDLDSFVTDLTDRNLKRHYALANKQSAIHKWLIRECMHDIGLEDEASSDPYEWNQALYGKYAYCRDHHISGIDPPCPSEDVIESSVNRSCWQRAYIQIDWSHAIMKDARGNPPGKWQTDPSDSAVQSIETKWAACMQTEGYRYQSRVDMYASFGTAANLPTDVRATLPDEADVSRSAEHCFKISNYYELRDKLYKKRSNEHYSRRHDVLEKSLKRYKAAERHGDEMIQQLCKLDSEVIVAMYEQDNYSQESICETSQ